MSRTTREINRITTTIISVSVKLLFYSLVIFLLYEGVTRGYSLGHEIFAPEAMTEAPGTDEKVAVSKGESVSEVAGRLEKDGLIRNKLIFIIQSKFYDYEIYPGTYTLNTSMTSRDMLKLIDESGLESKKAAEAEGSSSDGSTTTGGSSSGGSTTTGGSSSGGSTTTGGSSSGGSTTTGDGTSGVSGRSSDGTGDGVPEVIDGGDEAGPDEAYDVGPDNGAANEDGAYE